MTTSASRKEQNLDQLPGQAGDYGAALRAALEAIGEEFGIYEVVSRSGPLTSACLATQVGVPEQYARLWLDVQTAGNYLNHHVATGLYWLSSGRKTRRSNS